MLRFAIAPILVVGSAGVMEIVSECGNSINLPTRTVNDNSYGTADSGITVEDECQITGCISTVNGGIRIGKGSTVGMVQSIGGGITFGPEAHILYSVSGVGGVVRGEANSIVSGSVNSILSAIVLQDCTVHENITTVRGSIGLNGTTEVLGDIVIYRSPDRKGWDDKSVHIFVKDVAYVHGNIRNEDPEAEVTVHISADAHVDGKIENAKVVKVE